ncbi:BrxA family protein [Polaribacter sp. 11A2H]|uniref:BrxA family protein n=1 Tax=Polaribacter sp. 11A2H TaxID=2687290 RepID=UPI0014090133|nr:BrxA family protein [Polaribacter sp. 11A2H]
MILKKEYNSNLLKGTGLIQEMLILIDAYDNSEPYLEFQERVVKDDLLSKSTENRVIDIVRNIFKDRFLGYEINIPEVLKEMREEYVSMSVLTQIFFLYTCRANRLLVDFIIEVYFKKLNNGYHDLKSSDPKDFIKVALSDGRINSSWSESTINKVSQHIIATLIDFELIERNKTILKFRIFDLTANYLAHELHFRGVSDNNIWTHKDWSIFGLKPQDVIPVFERLANQGTFIMQFSGELLSISWKNKSMKDFINNECK